MVNAAPGLVDLLMVMDLVPYGTLYVDLWWWRKQGMLAVNLSHDPFDLEVTLAYHSFAVLPRAVEGSLACPAMAGRVFEKIRSRNSCEIDVFVPGSVIPMKNHMIPW